MSDGMSDDMSDDVSGDMADDVSGNMTSAMPGDTSGDVLDDVFSQYGRVRESATLRTKKVSVLVTEAEHAAITEWTRRAQSVVGTSRTTASDVGRQLFAELMVNRTLTAAILERLIADTRRI
ncbi:MAG: hypothetical protein ABS80_23945 [Pseudonocardia sp. SCN 72-51]|nr:MAG: hypothetical protein ABS80_23945 [Pseudonocardia sp. SCN 72-51]